jgi:uncharacterized protein YndB with AHSA1/START domain
MQPKGTLVEDGGDATLTFRRVFPHARERVWDAIATPEGLGGWLMCTHAVIEGRVGGRIEMVSGPARYHSTGQILVWQPPRVLEYEWNVAPVPEMPRGERAIFRYELEPEGDSTQLVVTYRRLTLHSARGFLPGLHAFLERLEAQLDGRVQPDWLERFSALRADYPEWSGHATHAGQ